MDDNSHTVVPPFSYAEIGLLLLFLFRHSAKSIIAQEEHLATLY